jgi:hypothetical protein
MLAVLAVCASARAFPPATPARNQADAVASGPRQGDALLRQAADRVEQMGTVSAKVRQRGDLFGHRMVGSGVYLQGARGSRLVRFELRMQVGNQESTLQQVCDGEFLWSLRQTGNQSVLRRVDVRQVIEELNSGAGEGRGGQGGARVAQLPTLDIGGLAQLLRSLDESFDFGAVGETQLAGVPMYLLQGTWKRTAAEHLLPEQQEKIRAGKEVDWNAAPEELPNQVILLLGRDDLFPYHLEYRRSTAPHVAGSSGRVLQVLEWFEVRSGIPLDRELFRYQPGNLPVTDYTAQYLESTRWR